MSGVAGYVRAKQLTPELLEYLGKNEYIYGFYHAIPREHIKLIKAFAIKDPEKALDVIETTLVGQVNGKTINMIHKKFREQSEDMTEVEKGDNFMIPEIPEIKSMMETGKVLIFVILNKNFDIKMCKDFMNILM